MKVTIAQLPDGTIVSDRRGILVFPGDAVLRGPYVEYSPRGTEVGESATLLEVSSDDYRPETCHYCFEVEHTLGPGNRPDLAPKGQSLARHQLVQDDDDDHRREVWNGIVERANLGVHPDDHRRKRDMLTTARKALP